MRVTSVVGARPQFVKVAPVAAALTDAGHAHQIVHTGQHYDPALSDVFFSDLDIPAPLAHLGVGSGPHGRQTGAMLTGLEDVLGAAPPDWVVVYGDTNSTLAGALAAVKLHIPVAHVEAGLRSFNRRMPEEHNRVLTDHAADLLLAPTAVAMQHLSREGLGTRAVLVGDVMTDVVVRVRDEVLRHPPEPAWTLTQADSYVLATIHRAENTDHEDRLRAIVNGLAAISGDVLLAVHPRLAARARAFGVSLSTGALRPIDPLPYRVMIAAMMRSRGVVTDSGGLQKEAFVLRVPCTTVRTETEWPETLVNGWNVLAPDPANLPALVARPVPARTAHRPFGDGRAAVAVVRVLQSTAPS